MKSVLIVDDEQIVLDVLQRILSRLGYHTVIADSGADAMNLYSKGSYDLVLLDVLMPEKNGFEIAKGIKHIKPDQKIIMVTGLGEDAVEAQALSEQIGISNVLSKPFSFEKVRSILAALFIQEPDPIRAR